MMSYLSLLSTNDLGTAPPDYFNKELSSSASLDYSVSRSAYVEAGAGYEAENIYKTRSLASAILHQNPQNTLYSHHNQNIYVKIVQNTLSAPYTRLKAISSRPNSNIRSIIAW